MHDHLPNDSDTDTAAEFMRARAVFERAQELSEEEREAWLGELDAAEPQAVRLARRMLRCWEGENAFERPLADLEGILRSVREEEESQSQTETDEEGQVAAPRLPDFGARYVEITFLGRGGVGEVYRGEQVAPAVRPVALKLLPWSYLIESDTRRFMREARALARLEHPGVARIYEASSTPDGRLFIAMEFVEGKAIDAWIREDEPDFATRMRIFSELCAAVEHAHHRGVVHRDLKPSNVLVTSDGADGAAHSVRVIDFGIAKLTGEGVPAVSAITQTGQVLGTLDYMSPEQREGVRDADTRMDIYALGAILYLLVTGWVLRRERSEEDARDDAPIPLHEAPIIPRAWRRDLAAIIGKATAHDPDRRYQGAAALGEDVQRLLADEPLIARPARSWERFVKLVRRRPRTAAVVLVLALVATGALGALVRSRSQLAVAVSQLSTEQREQAILTGALVADVLERLESIVGTSGARRALAEQLLLRTRSLLALAPEDEALIEAEARIMRAIGDIELGEGKAQSALPWREGARDRLAQLAAKRPEDTELARRHAEAIVLVGDLYFEQGDRERAQREYRRAFEIHRSLAERRPDDVAHLDDLTWSYDRFWSVEFCESDPEALLALMGERVALAERLVELDPSRALSRFSLMEGHYRVAITLDRMHRIEEAGEAIFEAIRLGEDLLVLEPHRLHFRFNLAKCLSVAEYLTLMLGRPEEGREIVARLEELTRAMLREDPDHRWAGQMRVMSLGKQAVLLRDEGFIHEAREKVWEMLTLIDEIEERTGETLDWMTVQRTAWKPRLENPEWWLSEDR